MVFPKVWIALPPLRFIYIHVYKNICIQINMHSCTTQTRTHVRVCIFISIDINTLWGDYPIFPICACAIDHVLTDLPNAHAQCFLQRASAMLLTMYNALACCHFALAHCNLQRRARCHYALAWCYLQCTTRYCVVTNTPLRFYKWPHHEILRSPACINMSNTN